MSNLIVLAGNSQCLYAGGLRSLPIDEPLGFFSFKNISSSNIVVIKNVLSVSLNVLKKNSLNYIYVSRMRLLALIGYSDKL